MGLPEIEYRQLGEGESALDRAHKAVHGDRQRDYGHPSANHERTAALWSAFLGFRITPREVCWLNVLQKLARDRHRPTADNETDIAGYAENACMMRAASDELAGVLSTAMTAPPGDRSGEGGEVDDLIDEEPAPFRTPFYWRALILGEEPSGVVDVRYGVDPHGSAVVTHWRPKFEPGMRTVATNGDPQDERSDRTALCGCGRALLVVEWQGNGMFVCSVCAPDLHDDLAGVMRQRVDAEHWRHDLDPQWSWISDKSQLYDGRHGGGCPASVWLKGHPQPECRCTQEHAPGCRAVRLDLRDAACTCGRGEP